jgi:protein-S-isoprenylcysteine O-methyltransferase Ste14
MTCVAAWASFFLLQGAASGRRSQAVRKESIASRFLHFTVFFGAVLLLLVPQTGVGVLGDELWTLPPSYCWAGAATTIAGLAWTVIARLQLGRQWSASVAINEDHRLIRTGLYSWSRHPMYTGLCLASIGTGLADGRVRAALACVALIIRAWWKSGLEERWLMERFPSEYPEYKRRVKRLVPRLL